MASRFNWVLPDALLKEAEASGLRESQPLGNLLAAELRRRKAAADFNQVFDGIRALPGEPISEESRA